MINKPAPQVPDHELLRLIGRGSYGEVWLARNVMGTYRAVKVVYRDTFESQRPYEREFAGIQKFEPISRSHDSQVDILHVGRNDQAGYFYYVMELADDAGGGQLSVASGQLSAASNQLSVISNQYSVSRGQSEEARSLNTEHCSLNTYSPKTLRSELQRRGRLPVEECLDIALSLTTALEHLHQHGLVHRDIKPSNIIFVNGRPKLADIGLVADVGKTMSFVGTEGYLPPEGPGSPQGDLYSLGKVLYEISTGKDRLDFPELPTNLEAIREEDALLEFNEVLVEACQAEAHKRYQSAEGMHADLLLLQSGKSVKRLRSLERRLAVVLRVGIGAVGVALMAAAGLYTARHRAKVERQERERADHLLYIANMNLAQHAIDDSNFRKASELVRQYFPGPGEKDWRGWEWRYLWQLCRSDELFSLPSTPNDSITSLMFAPDGRVLATGSYLGKVSLWDVRTRQEIGSVRVGADVNELAFSKDEKILAVAAGPFVRLYDPLSLDQVGRWMEHADTVESLAISPDGKTIVTVSAGRLRLWTVESGHELLSENVEASSSVTFSPDGRRLAFGRRENALWIWDIEMKSPACVISGTEFSRGSRLTFSPDGQILAYARAGNANARGSNIVLLWDVETGREITRLASHRDYVQGIGFSPHGRTFATASGDQTVKLWDRASWKELATLKGHSDIVHNLAFSPDGKILATGSRNGEVKIWSAIPPPSAAASVKLSENTFGYYSPRIDYSPTADRAKAVFGFALSPDNSRLLLAHDGTDAKSLWDVSTLQEVGRFPMTNNFAVSPQAKFLASGSYDGSVKLWDSAGLLLTNFVGHTASVTRLRFSHDGKQLATDDSQRIIVWDVINKKQMASFPSRNNTLSRFSFSPDDRLLAAGYWGGWVTVWNLATLQPIADFQAHGGIVTGIAVSADGRKLAIASYDVIAKLWNLETLQEIAKFPRALVGYNAVAFSPDGRRIVVSTVGQEGTVRIFDSDTGLEVAALRHGAVQNVAEIGFSADGDTLVHATCEMISLWRAPSFAEIEEAEKAASSNAQ